MHEITERPQRATGARPTLSDDERTIDALLMKLYDVISFERGGEPDWSAMRDVFSPHARITRIRADGIDYLTLSEFQDMAKSMLAEGKYASFCEYEVMHTVRRFGAMAHVLSAYETKESHDAPTPFARGLNSLQLILEADGWRVLSLLWDEERPGNPISIAEAFGRDRASEPLQRG